MLDLIPIIVTLIVFASVVGVVFVLGRYLTAQAAITRRLAAAPMARGEPPIEAEASNILTALADKIDESKFGVTGALRAKLRMNLVRAGYFSNNAIRLYIVTRMALVLILPVLAFIYAQIFLPFGGLYLSVALVAISALVAFFGSDAYISRRQTRLQMAYRISFPNLVDMLVVCIDAGLALDGALNRVRPEVFNENHALGTNLAILNAETRAGRSMSDALGNLADRLNLDEARALAVMLRQSIELGTDVGDALRVFSDEMRNKRLLRAEEQANKLPVKMVLPLGLFIFPVILMVVLVPVLIRLMGVLYRV